MSRKTIVFSLYAGPGAGKSVLAAQLYSEFAKRGKSVELVHEWVKGWAWRNLTPKGSVDGLYIFAKQWRMESTVYSKVDYIITDSPLGLCPIYEELYNPSSHLIRETFNTVQTEQHASGLIENVNLFVQRSHKYVKEGRFETEEAAARVDALCLVRHQCEIVDGFESAVKKLEVLGYL